MSHIKIIASLLLLFFNMSVNAKAACALLEKNIDLFKYSFRCNNEIVNIQCKIEDPDVCSVNIKSKLESMKFDITADELKSFNLFSKSEQKVVECDSTQKLCETKSGVCDKYKNFFEGAKSDVQNSFGIGTRCNGLMSESVLGVAQLSTEFVAEPEFKKNSCETKHVLDLQTLKNKIALFQSIVNKPILDRESFLYGCVNQDKGSDLKMQDGKVLSKVPQLKELQSSVLRKMKSNEYLINTVCEDRAPMFFTEGKLNVDNVMCAVFEESKLELLDKTITCNGEKSRVSMGASARERSAEASGASLARADTTPIEQKAMPEAMASQIGKPVGLAPALAQVDQIAPGSGSTSGTSYESTMAAGAVRNTIPTNIASQAGQAFAPVYERLSTIGKSVSPSSASVRPGIIGSGSPARSGATGIVTVTRKNPSSTSYDSTASVAEIAERAGSSASNGLAKTSGATDGNKANKAATIATSSRGDETAPARGGGPRSLNLGNGGGASGASSRSPSNSDTVGGSDFANSPAAATVQKKITQLNSPAQITSFFKDEAINIPNLRELLYSDSATSKILASKGIRVVNQSGDVAGESVSKAKYLFSDDGSKFTPLKMAKKN